MDENFRYKTSNYSLHYVLRQIESGRMEVDPDFKDLKHKSIKDRSLFIESLILGIPTQPIWCEESPSGDYIVIEGGERLITLVDFVKGRFSLSYLKIRKEYQDCNFDSLPYHEKISLEDRYPFSFVIINYDTPYYLKCEFFRRLLNDTGSSNDQSARNFAWRNSFNFLQNIKSDCQDLIEFAPRNVRWREPIRSSKGRTEIDEFFLYLLMIDLILKGDVFERAYLDSSISIDDLLDWTMSYYNDDNEKMYDAAKQIYRGISKISKIDEDPLRLILSKTRGASNWREERIMILPEFYYVFIRAITRKLYMPIDWEKARVQRFLDSSSAKNFINYIFQARDD